jgi:peptide/nickel transport system substrate-binding protein
MHIKKDKPRIHPAIPDLAKNLKNGNIDRREFLRTTTLLGLSAGAAYTMANNLTGIVNTVVPAAKAQTPKKGGTLRVSMEVQEMTDPSTFSWVQMSNVARHINEFLTITGTDNITRPYLCEKWEASDDLTEWTFHLQKGIKWHNGDDFTAEDVAFNFNRWLDPATGSSNIGLFSAMVEDVDAGEKNDDGTPKMTKRAIDGAVNIVDDHTVKIKNKQSVLSVPENLYNYPTMIVHRGFQGDIGKENNGTGPYQLAEFAIGEKAILKRTDKPYWGGEVYLDEIHYYDHGSASSAQMAALASGQVDSIYEFDIGSLQMAQNMPGFTIYEAKTAQTGVARMAVTEKPFDNKLLRQAMMHAIDTSIFPKFVFQGNGVSAEHHHVAQIHPEYFQLPAMKQDIEKGKKLLVDAGYPNGIEISIDVGNTNGPWQQHTCELMKEQLAKIGVTLNLNVIPSSKYWEIWDKTPFGFTAWTHRPLGTMVMSLAYRSGVPWNESRYANAEFDAALDKAESLVDVEQRRAAMEEVERIIQDDAIILQPLWIPKFFAANDKVKGLEAHPTQYHQFHKVWIDA